jgi:hypothetical protein
MARCRTIRIASISLFPQSEVGGNQAVLDYYAT